MKTIFKHLFSIIAILTMSVGFVSCDDENSENEASSIIGTWIYEEDYDDDEYYYEEITFKSNGTFIVKWEEYYYGEYDSETERGTYELDGDELIVELDDEIIFVTVVSITSSKLVLEDEEGDRLIYYRK